MYIVRSTFILRGITPLSVGRGLAPAEYSIYPRVILSEGRSPQSNPEGVCAAQDLRGGNRISVRDPDTTCRAPRSTSLRSAQDDTDGLLCSNIVVFKFYASGKMISSPTMNIIKHAPYRRGGYYPPEYNKKDFRQSENLPKLFIFHCSIFIIH